MGNNANEEKKEDIDDFAANAKQKYDEIMHPTNEIGIGSSLWILCKILIDSRPKDEDSEIEQDKIPKLTHISPSQLLLIERILKELHALNVSAIMDILLPLWSLTFPIKKPKKK